MIEKSLGEGTVIGRGLALVILFLYGMEWGYEIFSDAYMM